MSNDLLIKRILFFGTIFSLCCLFWYFLLQSEDHKGINQNGLPRKELSLSLNHFPPSLNETQKRAEASKLKGIDKKRRKNDLKPQLSTDMLELQDQRILQQLEIYRQLLGEDANLIDELLIGVARDPEYFELSSKDMDNFKNLDEFVSSFGPYSETMRVLITKVNAKANQLNP